MLAVRPQVILLIVSGKAAAGFIRAYRDKGASATFVSLSNTSNGDYVKALGDQARGSIVMQVLPSPYAQTTALAREYGSDARAAAQPLSYAGLYGYATAKLLTLGLERAGRTPTRESLIAALEGAGRWDLGGFPVTYGQGRREGSGFVDSTIITRDGKFLG
jgi:branched-chain amino acid transport system substrate-binding protein